MAVACVLSVASCKKENYAEKFVGTYSVSITPTVAGIALAPQNAEATILLDGEEGGVKCTLDGKTVSGTATKDGLQLDPTPYSSTIVIMGRSAKFTLTLKHDLIKAPNEKGVMTWSADMEGEYTIGSSTTRFSDGKAVFVATKR